jgi:hypothetical protein
MMGLFATLSIAMICHDAECRVLLVNMLSVVMASVFKVNFIVLSAVAPQLYKNILRVDGPNTKPRLLYKSLFIIT